LFDCSGLRVRRGLSIHLLLVVVALTVSLWAQEENPNAGTVQGTVRDDVGAPVEGARVLYNSQATDTRGATRTDKDGKYVSEVLPPGVYVVRIEGRDMIPIAFSARSSRRTR
jgi:protocatechuate 3,4-dioxygenase beta subunit